MGMYTGLRVKCVVKPEWAETIWILMTTQSWLTAAEAVPATRAVCAAWNKHFRANFIPFGSMEISLQDWVSEHYVDYDVSTRVWDFACSLKNYEDEINVFLAEVLRHIAESVEHCETRYEENDASTYYDFDGDQFTARVRKRTEWPPLSGWS